MANEVRLIDANALLEAYWEEQKKPGIYSIEKLIINAPIIEPDSLRPKGRWVLKAHEELANFRWNVTAECSECHHDKGEVYAGFFSGFPKDIVETILLDCARSVKLDNHCPNCGAKMEG